jgi:hypothetical protein
MTWLNLRDAKQIGIEVLLFEEQTPATKPAQPDTPREASNQEISSRARLFVKEINSRLSRINAAEWVGQLYADEVISYGKLRSRREIVTEHRLYTEQWPERSYSIQDKSMHAVCGEVPVECIITGTMEWKGRNVARNVAASGISTFTYVLRPSGDTFIIKEVDAVPRRPTTYTTAY